MPREPLALNWATRSQCSRLQQQLDQLLKDGDNTAGRLKALCRDRCPTRGQELDTDDADLLLTALEANLRGDEFLFPLALSRTFQQSGNIADAFGLSDEISEDMLHLFMPVFIDGNYAQVRRSNHYGLLQIDRPANPQEEGLIRVRDSNLPAYQDWWDTFVGHVLQFLENKYPEVRGWAVQYPDGPQQPGGWECGFYMLASLATLLHDPDSPLAERDAEMINNGPGNVVQGVAEKYVQKKRK